jgi:hypothetical protein
VRARPRVCHYALLRRLVQGIMTTHLLILLTSKSRKAILGILDPDPPREKTCGTLFGLLCSALASAAANGPSPHR